MFGICSWARKKTGLIGSCSSFPKLALICKITNHPFYFISDQNQFLLPVMLLGSGMEPMNMVDWGSMNKMTYRDGGNIHSRTVAALVGRGLASALAVGSIC